MVHRIGVLLTALLSFNLGVEAGQVVIILATMAALMLVSRLHTAAVIPVIRLATYAIGGIAAMWFIERSFS